ALAGSFSLASAAENPIDSPMYHDPELPMPKVVPAHLDKVKPLWLKALARPEADVKRQAAQAIAVAHREGMKGLDAMVAPLRKVLEDREAHPAVRLAVARALIVLDARAAAESLFAQAQQSGGELRDLVE